MTGSAPRRVLRNRDYLTWGREFNFGEYTCNEIGIVFYMDIVNGWAGGATIKKPNSIPSTPGEVLRAAGDGHFGHVKQ
jgi:hypothetical protein